MINFNVPYKLEGKTQEITGFEIKEIDFRRDNKDDSLYLDLLSLRSFTCLDSMVVISVAELKPLDSQSVTRTRI